MKRIFSLLLALLLLTPALIACTKDDTSDTPDPAETTATTAPAETQPPEDELKDNLPEETFNGESIDMWMGYNLHSEYFNPSEEATDIISEAAHARNGAVQERFDVTLNYITGNDGDANNAGRLTEMEASILAGDEYDVVYHTISYLAPRMIAGCFINLNTNEFFDFSEPWWQNYIIDTVRVDERLYAVSGWFDMGSFTRSSVMYFSSEMAEAHGVEDLYQLVYDNKWTYDKMLEIAESVADDVDNDGAYTAADRYGIAGVQDWWFRQLYTTDYSWVTTNENGVMELTGMNDTLVTVFDYVSTLINEAPYYRSFYTYGDGIGFTQERQDELFQMFGNNQILFVLNSIGLTSKPGMRDHGAYGILPTPKFFETDEYGAAVSPNGSCIPITTGNLRTASIILTALNVESYKTVRPAFIDTALAYKFVNDKQSKEMVDIALANLRCDFGDIMMDNIGREIPLTLVRTTNLSSWMATYTPITNAMLKSLQAQFRALPE